MAGDRHPGGRGERDEVDGGTCLLSSACCVYGPDEEEQVSTVDNQTLYESAEVYGGALAPVVQTLYGTGL